MVVKSHTLSVVWLLLMLFLFPENLCLALSCYLAPDELYALQDLYNSTDGSQWTWRTNYTLYGAPWNFSTSHSDPCGDMWQGVGCRMLDTAGSAQCTISAISLAAYNLHGFVPTSLQSLRNLSKLDLSNNYLVSSVPAGLFRLNNISSIMLQNNYLTGSVTSQLTIHPNLKTLSLNNNFLTGTVVDSFTACGLVTLKLDDNQLNGTLPASLGACSQLTLLTVFNNHFSGTLPADWSGMKSMVNLVADLNGLNGTIPEVWGAMSHLSQLNLYTNQLTGTIPESLGHLQHLQQLYLDSNHLHGSIPDSFRHMFSVNELVVSDNYLSGSLPDSLFANLTDLLVLAFSDNHLTGQLDRCNLTNLDALLQLTFNNNFFTGSLPSNWSDMHDLQQLFLYNNFLSQTLPESMGTLSHLLFLSLDNNRFSGEVLSSFAGLQQLTLVSLYSNQFEGTIPAALFNIASSEAMYLYANQLDGSLPSECGNMQALGALFVSSNYLDGTLPLSLAQLSSLTIFVASNNVLSGSLWNRFASQFHLRQIFVAQNVLTGSLYDLFAATISVFHNASNPVSADDLLAININQNYFTGTLPTDILAIGRLQSFIASLNCFHGTIPASLCNNGNLTDLQLDGLHAASRCSRQLMETVTNSQFFTVSQAQSYAIYGSIPACLFTSLPMLHTLHLSGNALTGTIPHFTTTHNSDRQHNDSAVVYSPSTRSLQNLDLSHNVLTGKVPDAMWRHSFLQLDLSFNRLSGTIAADTNVTYRSNDSSLSLQVNRLSGPLPAAWIEAPNIQILNGNMYDCERNSATTRNLPLFDPYSSTYECGSIYTTYACVLSGVALGLVIFIGLYLQWTRGGLSWWQHLLKSIDLEAAITDVGAWDWLILSPSGYERSATSSTDQNLWRGLKLLCALCLLLILLYLPIYVILSTVAGTYTHQYVWIASLSLLEGETAAAVSLVLLLILTVLVLVLDPFKPWLKNDDRSIHHQNQHDDNLSPSTTVNDSCSSDGTSVDSVSTSTSGPTSFVAFVCISLQRLDWLALMLLNFGVVLVVNICYVYLSENRHVSSTAILALAAIALSLFKLLWSTVVVTGFANGRTLSRSSQKSTLLRRSPARTQSMPKKAVSSFSNGSWAVFSMHTAAWMNIVNNILVPLLAELFASANCLQYALTQAPTVTTDVSGGTCFLVFYSQISSSVNETAFVCGTESTLASSFKYYEITGVYAAGAATQVSYQPGFVYNFQCSSSLLHTFVAVFILRFLASGVVVPIIWLLLHWYRSNLWRQSVSEPMLTSNLATSSPISISSSAATASLSYRQYKLVTALLPPLLKPLAIPKSTGQDNHREDLALISALQVNLHWTRDMLTKPASVLAAPLFIRLVTDVAMLLSFGVLFPPLAVVIAFSVLVDVFMTQMMWLRVLQIRQQTQHLLSSGNQHDATAPLSTAPSTSVVSIINPLAQQRTPSTYPYVASSSLAAGLAEQLLKDLDALLGVWQEQFAHIYRHLWWVLRTIGLGVSSLLWAFALFDILSNASDARGSGLRALWIFFVTLSAPLWIGAAVYGIAAHLHRANRDMSDGAHVNKPSVSEADTTHSDIEFMHRCSHQVDES